MLAGRFSDRMGRKMVTFGVVACVGFAFVLFFSGITSW